MTKKDKIYKYYLQDLSHHGGVQVTKIKNNEYEIGKGLEVYAVPALADYSLVNAWANSFLGHALTVLDASISNEKQLKASKDILRQAFYNQMNQQYKMMNPFSEIG